MKKTALLSVLLLSMLSLTACGGDNGVTTPPPPTDNNPPPTGGNPAPYTPPSGIWNGQPQAGTWCAAKPTAAAAPQARSALIATVDRRGLAQHWDAPHTAGRILVYRAPGTLSAQAEQATLSRLNLRLTATDQSGWTVLDGADSTLRANAQALIDSGTYQYAQPEYHHTPAGLPAANDVSFTKQKAALDMLGLPAAWQKVEPGCKPIIIAVLDSGVDASDDQVLPNLTPRASWATFSGNVMTQGVAEVDKTNEDKNGAWHGHAVAGAIAQVAGNSLGGAGATYNLAKVLPLNVFEYAQGAGYVITSTNVARAVQYAAGQVTMPDGKTYVNPYPAQLMNLSFGDGQNYWSGDDAYLMSYLTAALKNGTVVVAAAGNFNNPVVSHPAQNSYVIAVGSVDAAGARSSFSNYGQGLDFVAPGERVLTRFEGADSAWSGTSFATPLFTSQLALWMYANEQYSGSPNAGRTGEGLWNHMMTCLAAASSTKATWNASNKTWSGSWNDQTGAGLVNTAALVDANNTTCR
ncbi:S8 family serine peptidase [Deinococcus soli (ex Cha et al. 2016)]|uniref:Peptidase S8/S53 domain-containing protein n=2 Tax=Deinococcus soli (ex Cha et al. 2016) TaxID=1309411 RepID=A0AAE3XD39_9DEIO|nr:S8 family serine peptidase [Deinococcus soli (ex Cha et al. 2016)]MDR6218454.1 hypothetical protein [Deinococcus soli (ex Cha et al. 2016)]MDR6329194.1 hypothetical protein [Deinococcus soli (ex Cha et al. 2016)]MDR6751467.1 hypothetical protein [Deinococcus soli (ex Cha et al. 2016)]